MLSTAGEERDYVFFLLNHHSMISLITMGRTMLSKMKITIALLQSLLTRDSNSVRRCFVQCFRVELFGRFGGRMNNDSRMAYRVQPRHLRSRHERLKQYFSALVNRSCLVIIKLSPKNVVAINLLLQKMSP